MRSLRDTSIMVTGGGGFLGTHVALALKNHQGTEIPEIFV